jgi:hypothetical protein
MPSEISRSISISFASMLLVTAFVGVPENAARAADCAAAPGSSAPQGSHWYYRLDRTTHDKCWHLGESGRTAPTASPPQGIPAEGHRLARNESEVLYAQFLEWQRRTNAPLN